MDLRGEGKKESTSKGGLPKENREKRRDPRKWRSHDFFPKKKRKYHSHGVEGKREKGGPFSS